MAFDPNAARQIPGSGRNEGIRNYAQDLQQRGVTVVSGQGPVVHGGRGFVQGGQPLPVQVVPVQPVQQGVPLAAQGRGVQYVQRRDVPLSQQNLNPYRK
ncbi:hypothetical protein [Estrella lausannensis]|uniref:Uncharacterized protein n=1 Tax=Estrella lausannensis TaxID=483423 RepID=A0A0H5E7F6_9BACT|nr:hypothetical protein [Estrella lausannensis]CRX39270.1 Hypothetical protein ELAC_1946 [Estrella lausannensis]